MPLKNRTSIKKKTCHICGIIILIITTFAVSGCATKTIVHHCNPVEQLLGNEKSDDWVCEKYWWSR